MGWICHIDNNRNSFLPFYRRRRCRGGINRIDAKNRKDWICYQFTLSALGHSLQSVLSCIEFHINSRTLQSMEIKYLNFFRNIYMASILYQGRNCYLCNIMFYVCTRLELIGLLRVRRVAVTRRDRWDSAKPAVSAVVGMCSLVAVCRVQCVVPCAVCSV